MPVIEENTGFIYCVEVNLDDVVVIRLVGLHTIIGSELGGGFEYTRGFENPNPRRRGTMPGVASAHPLGFPTGGSEVPRALDSRLRTDRSDGESALGLRRGSCWKVRLCR